MPNGHEIQPAPKLPENNQPPELLSENNAGLQAAILFDGYRHGTDPVPDNAQWTKLSEDIKNNTLKTTKINNGSLHEREEFWKKPEYVGKNPDEQKVIWVTETNKLFAGFNDDEKKFLQDIGINFNNGAEAFYNEYFINNKGELAYLARKIAALDKDNIDKNRGLINTIGKFYGEESAELLEHLSEGIKNVQQNFPDFEMKASDQFNNLVDNETIKKIHNRDEAWNKKRKDEEDEKRKQQREQLIKPVNDAFEKIKADKLLTDFQKILEPLLNPASPIPDQHYNELIQQTQNTINALEVDINDKNKDDKDKIITLLTLFDELDNKYQNETDKNLKDHYENIRDLYLKHLESNKATIIDIKPGTMPYNPTTMNLINTTTPPQPGQDINIIAVKKQGFTIQFTPLNSTTLTTEVRPAEIEI
jgi:hypothetical protein